MLHYITLYYIMLHYVTLYYIILHYVTLYYIILHYITLYFYVFFIFSAPVFHSYRIYSTQGFTFPSTNSSTGYCLSNKIFSFHDLQGGIATLQPTIANVPNANHEVS